MSNSSTILRRIFNDARPLVEQALDLSEQFKGFRELATANGLDWSQIKALLKAQIQDEREDDGKNRVGRIIEKADFATAYADMLGLGSNMNENNFSAEDAEAAQAEMNRRKSKVFEYFSPPPHDEDGVLIEDVPANGPATALAPGAGGPTTAKGDAGEIPFQDASPTIPESVAVTLPDLATVAPDPSPEVRSGAPTSDRPEIKFTALTESTSGGLTRVAGEWEDLEIPPQFDRREKVE